MQDNVKSELSLLGINPENPLPQMGKMIADGKHLRAFLCKIPAINRKRAYDDILPHLSFKPKPYWLLMR